MTNAGKYVYIPVMITIEAIQLGEAIQVKKFLDKFKFKSISKEPHIIAWGEESHIILFRYGVIVFWNIEEGEKNKILGMLKSYVTNPLKEPFTETLGWKKGKKIDIIDGVIQSSELDIPSRQLIAVSLARTVVMDFFETKVDHLLKQFTDIIEHFTQTGRSKLSGKSLLRLAGAAMSINNQTVSHMAMLDKPDFIWNNTSLDVLFTELEEEHEISERYIVLTKKIETLLHDSEFIMNVLDSRQSHLLELIIILLFVVDIAVFFIEKSLSV